MPTDARHHDRPMDAATGRTTWAKARRVAGVLALVVFVTGMLGVFFVVPGPMIHTEAAAEESVAFTKIDDREVAVGAEIAGLGAEFSTDPSHYGYAPEPDAVVAETTSGKVKLIAVDSLKAVDADAGTAAAWSCFEVGSPHAAGPTDLLDTASRADGSTLTVAASPAHAPAERRLSLFVTDESGPRPLGEGTFFGGAARGDFFVPEEPTPVLSADGCRVPAVTAGDPPAAGLSSGLVLVHSLLGPETFDDRVLSVVDADTGEVLATLDADHDVQRAVTAPSGTLVIIADTDLDEPLDVLGALSSTSVVHLANADGDTTQVVLGHHGRFGL